MSRWPDTIFIASKCIITRIGELSKFRFIEVSWDSNIDGVTVGWLVSQTIRQLADTDPQLY